MHRNKTFFFGIVEHVNAHASLRKIKFLFNAPLDFILRYRVYNTVKMKNKEGLSISQLAKKSRVNVQTVRFYERKGLLPRPRRTPSGYRMFTEADARRVVFIKRAQELGFSLKEIKGLLSLRAMPTSRCGQVLHKAEEKIKEIEIKIQSLASMKQALLQLKAECEGSRPIQECPILAALDKKEEVP